MKAGQLEAQQPGKCFFREFWVISLFSSIAESWSLGIKTPVRGSEMALAMAASTNFVPLQSTN